MVDGDIAVVASDPSFGDATRSGFAAGGDGGWISGSGGTWSGDSSETFRTSPSRKPAASSVSVLLDMERGG